MCFAELKGARLSEGNQPAFAARMEGRPNQGKCNFPICVTPATSRLPPKWRYTCKGSSNLRAVQLYETISLVAVNVS